MVEPFLADPDVQLYHGDALDVLRELPDESVHMCVTSPPFYGLRNYGVDGQIGLEETPEQWVDKLVAVFREVRRVLRSDGTCWIELGDSYAHSNPAGGGSVFDNGRTDGRKSYEGDKVRGREKVATLAPGTKPKDLIGAPWLLAFALRADGWYLRSEIIWAKPNPMPESVTDRPTTAHSRVFLLSKSPRYFFDSEAVREKYTDPREGGDGFRWNSGRYTNQPQTMDNSTPTPCGPDGRRATHVQAADGSIQHRDGERWPNPSGRNVRSVWEIATEPFPEAHFATFPQALVRRCILAGTSERGCCPVCGAPWMREVEQTYTPGGTGGGGGRKGDGSGMIVTMPERKTLHVTTTGWQPSCEHKAAKTVIRPPCTVLDPFMGSGTTAFVARKLGRRAIGIDLNADYLEMASRRLAQQSLFATEASA